MIPVQVPMTIAESAVEFQMDAQANAVSLAVGVGLAINVSTFPDYDGGYVFTPTENTQTVVIEDMVARQNIVINPIPSNWGKITWNGNTLTVS